MVNRVLIYRLGSLGDTVMMLPALHLVERAFPESHRVMLTNIPVNAKAPAAFSVLDGSGLVQGFIDYPVATRSFRKLVQLWWRVLRFRPQVVIYLMSMRPTAKRDFWFFRLCGVRRIVGFVRDKGDLPLYDPKSGLWEHEAARMLRVLGSIGSADANDPASWDMRLTEAEQRKAELELASVGDRPMIACGPGTKMQSKDWGREKWRALLGQLGAALPGHALVLVGAKDDTEVSDYVGTEWRGPKINLCGKLTPRETAAVLRRAELFVGPDSGPMHLAAAVGVPCAIAFSSIDRPGRWYPCGTGHRPIYHQVDCASCLLETCIEQKKKCINSISVEEMFTAALEAWREGQRTSSER